MRVLFISNHIPASLITSTQGIHKRMRMFIEAISEVAELDVLFYVSPDTDCSASAIAKKQSELSNAWGISLNLTLCPISSKIKSLPKLQQQFDGIFNFFHQSDYADFSDLEAIRGFEQALLRKPDAVFIHRLNSMCPVMLTNKPLPPVFFDLDDIEHIKFLRQIRQPPTRLLTLLYALQVPARQRGEIRAIRQTCKTFVCSEHDRQLLANQHGLTNVAAIPNAITIPEEPQPIASEPTLLLLGGYYYFPNANAANFLIEQVWPLVQKTIPTAQLIIAGPQPETIRSYGKNLPGVEFTGFVDDLDALYRRSRIVCCPIFSGGGTRVKMIEAAAYGKPIVSTRIGAEGLEMISGQDYLLADRAQDFAAACIELLKDDARCQQLATAARKAAIQHYDRGNIIRLIQQHLGTVAPSPSSSYVYPNA